MSTILEPAKLFFEACETGKGWAGCKEYVADGASFVAQSEPLAETDTVEAYCEWMAGFATVAPGATYDLHVSCFDDATRTAIFFADAGIAPIKPSFENGR